MSQTVIQGEKHPWHSIVMDMANYYCWELRQARQPMLVYAGQDSFS
jgi:hypothetical protein